MSTAVLRKIDQITYMPSSRHKPNADAQFNERTSPRNRRFTIAAAASEDEPAKDGDVVVPADRGLAVGTAGTRFDDGLSLWDAGDADIEKTAEEKPNDKGGEFDDAWGDHRKSIRFRRTIPYVRPKSGSPDLSLIVRGLCTKKYRWGCRLEIDMHADGFD